MLQHQGFLCHVMCKLQERILQGERKKLQCLFYTQLISSFSLLTWPFVILRQDGIHLWPLKAFLNVVVIYQLKLCPMYFRQKVRGFFATLLANIGHRFYPICHFQMKSNLADIQLYLFWLNIVSSYSISRYPPAGTVPNHRNFRTRSGINGLALICHKTTSIKGPLWFGWKMTLFQGYFCQCCS